MCPPRRFGMDKDTLLQIVLVVLFVILATLVWLPLADLLTVGV